MTLLGLVELSQTPYRVSPCAQLGLAEMTAAVKTARPTDRFRKRIDAALFRRLDSEKSPVRILNAAEGLQCPRGTREGGLGAISRAGQSPRRPHRAASASSHRTPPRAGRCDQTPGVSAQRS